MRLRRRRNDLTAPAAQPAGAPKADDIAAEAPEAGGQVDVGKLAVARAALAQGASGAAAPSTFAQAGERGRRLARLRARLGRARTARTGRVRPRWLTAVLIALALAVPGGATVGTTMTMMDIGRDPGPDSTLDGSLPFEGEAASLDTFMEPDQLEAVPVGPEPVADSVRAVLSSSQVIEELGESDVPEVALRAYTQAADRLATDDPECGIRWTLLAAIGRVESNHGRFGGAELREDGYGTRPIRGIPLDGRDNVALIRDTDDAALDGDSTYDRAVGPMQFIPSTWQSVGVDANGDGRRDPNNIFDAAQGAAAYLCSSGGNLREMAGQAQAVRQYNNADEYVRVVLSLAQMYETGRVVPLPSLPGIGGPDSGSDRGSGPVGPGSGSDPDSGPGSGSGSGSGAGSGSGGQPAPAPGLAPRPDSGGEPAPRPTTTAPQRSTTTTAPAPRPAPAPPTTAPPRSTTTTTAPEPTTTTTAPAPTTTTAPPPSTTTTAPPEPETPDTAAVGWAPAMREVVVEVLEEEEAAPAPPTTAPPAPETTVPPAAEAPTPSTTQCPAPGTEAPPPAAVTECLPPDDQPEG
jgi:hypothetical protein